ncbi:hypothetical protein [Persephonella sp.]
MKGFSQIISWNWQLLKCCKKPLILGFFYVLLNLAGQIFFPIALITGFFFQSLSIFIGGVFFSSVTDSEYIERYKNTPWTTLFIEKLPQTTGWILAMIVISIPAVVFFVGLIVAFQGEENIAARAVAGLFLLTISLVMMLVFYVIPYILGKIAIKGQGFKDSFLTGLSSLSPSVWKKVVFNLNYFLLQIKFILFFVAVVAVFILPLVLLAPAVKTSEEAIVFLILSAIIYFGIFNFVVYFISSYIMPSFWTVSYQYVDEKAGGKDEEDRQAEDTP